MTGPGRREGRRLVHDARGPLAVLAVEIQNLRALRRALDGVDPAHLRRMDAILDNLEGIAARGLDALDAIAEALDAGTPSSHPPDPGIPTGGAVLIVDDEPPLRRALERRLEQRWPVVTAGSVAEATRCLDERGDISAVLCDVHLPDGDVWRLLEWLQAHRTDLVDRTIAMTGGDVGAGARVGPERLVWARKPDDMARIDWFIARLLGQERAGRV